MLQNNLCVSVQIFSTGDKANKEFPFNFDAWLDSPDNYLE